LQHRIIPLFIIKQEKAASRANNNDSTITTSLFSENDTMPHTPLTATITENTRKNHYQNTAKKDHPE